MPDQEIALHVAVPEHPAGLLACSTRSAGHGIVLAAMASTKRRPQEHALERLARDVIRGNVALQRISPFEQRMAWDMPNNSGSLNAATLRTGMRLSAIRLRWETPALTLVQSPSLLKFTLARGPGTRVAVSDGSSHSIHGGAFEISRINRAVRMQYDLSDRGVGAHQEYVALSIDPARLNELLGTQALPARVRQVVEASAVYARAELPMNGGLFRLLDEILHAEARGNSRQIYLEAKGLELLAGMIDRVEECDGAARALSQWDIERLERARRILLERMVDPPTIPELARQAGINEPKLKEGFRRLFGSPVFVYLRNHRMEEACRLLRERRYTVTEVALRVGYANPSKFAAAFRRRFGVSPKAVA